MHFLVVNTFYKSLDMLIMICHLVHISLSLLLVTWTFNIVLLMLGEDNTSVLYHQQQHEHNYEMTHNLSVHDLSILTLLPIAFIPIAYSCYTPYWYCVISIIRSLSSLLYCTHNNTKIIFATAPLYLSDTKLKVIIRDHLITCIHIQHHNVP